MTVFLIDLASYQHGIDLAAVKAAGFTRVNVKISEGTSDGVNPHAATWIHRARELGLGVSTFHWLNGNHSGAAQAKVAIKQMQQFGVLLGAAHQIDCEDAKAPATWAIWRDYANAVQDAMQHHVIAYTGDWWWNVPGRNWAGATITPYLMAAPNAGYRHAYPGDQSSDWDAGYGGWAKLSAMQYSVSAIPGAYPALPVPPDRSTDLSKTAFRDPAVWAALTGTPLAKEEDDMGLHEWTAIPPADPAKAAFLTQGSQGFAGQQRDTALAFAWQRAAEASDKASAILDKLAAPTPVTVDAGAVAAALAGDETFVAALAKAINDEAARRMEH